MGLCMLNDRMEYKSRICLEFTFAYNYVHCFIRKNFKNYRVTLFAVFRSVASFSTIQGIC